MAMEGIKTPGSAYQGSNADSIAKTEQAVKQEHKVKLEQTAPVSQKAHLIPDERTAVKTQGQELSVENGKATVNSRVQLPMDAMKKAVEEINKRLVKSEAIFGIHDETNRATIKIINKETKEVLKEYPPEQMLDMIAKGWELAGILVDEKL